MIPLAGIGRDERFPDPVEQDKLQALSDKIDEATAFSDGDHRVVSTRRRRREWLGPSWTRDNARCCGCCWTPTSVACPLRCHPWRDPIADFGLDVLARHHATHPH